MRKLFILIACALLIGALAISVSAAGSSVALKPSATTLHRGDTFTVVAVLTNSDAINLGTVALSYDTNVFELTGGSCHVSGANPAMVAVAQKAGTFFLQNASAVSGNIFTFNFKVKSNAAFGTYNITPTAAIGTSTGVKINATGTKITVACQHNYGSWTKVNDTTHKHTCSVCQKEETASHTWNSGKVTKAASCKETGIKTYTCTTCKATKTETIAKTSSHSYGSWTKVNDTTHRRTCSACQKEETASHTWGSGKVTKAATCKETGIKTYTCTTCKATKTETIAKTSGHSYGSWTKVNDTTHKHTCSVCQKEETASHTWGSGKVTKAATCKEAGIKTYTCTTCNATKTETVAKLTTHTYKNDCDTDCNICDATRTVTHKYKTSWSKDKSGHWHECSVCKDKKDFEAHKPGAAATETKAQKCTVCSYVIKAATGHTHKYDTKWTTDGEGHWYACSGCDEKKDFAEHIFDDACDADCNECGYTRTATHTYKTEWFFDGDKHWHECSGCGEKADEVTHTPGAEATETAAQTCTECGYELAPAMGKFEKTDDGVGWENDIKTIILVCIFGAVAIIAGVVIIVKKDH